MADLQNGCFISFITAVQIRRSSLLMRRKMGTRFPSFFDTTGLYQRTLDAEEDTIGINTKQNTTGNLLTYNEKLVFPAINLNCPDHNNYLKTAVIELKLPKSF